MGLNHGWRGPNIVRDGLVLYLDAGSPNSYQGSGTTWKDISKFYQNNGTLVNGPTFSSGNGGSIVFDGVDDYVQTLTNPISNNSSFSIACWFNIAILNSTFRPLVDGGNVGSGTIGYTLSINNTNNIFIACDAGFKSINTAISINQWYYVVGTAVFGTPYILNVYVNGVLGTTVSSNNTNTMTNNVSYVRMGQNTSGGIVRYPGRIASTQIYNRALSPTEITQNYNATKGRFGL